jgi:zinc finger protein
VKLLASEGSEGKGKDNSDIVDKLLSEAGREPLLLHRDESVLCPACNSRAMTVEEYLYEVPYFGKIILSTGRCSSCGYSFKDVRVAEALNPRKIVVEVRGDRELRMLVAKSPLSSVLVKEVGASMVPGPASVGFITTVEGLIERFVEVAESACRKVENPDDRAKCEDSLEKLRRAKEGEMPVTIVICDYDGLSRVVGEGDVREEPMDEVCEALKPEWLKWSQGS